MCIYLCNFYLVVINLSTTTYGRRHKCCRLIFIWWYALTSSILLTEFPYQRIICVMLVFFSKKNIVLTVSINIDRYVKIFEL